MQSDQRHRTSLRRLFADVVLWVKVVEMPSGIRPSKTLEGPVMLAMIELASEREDQICQVCHCAGEGCDGTVCHGLDVD